MARLAQKGKGRKVRFQGGSLFPITILVVVVLGLALIVYGRVSQPKADASPPTVDDHWHQAFGIYVCDRFLPNLAGTAESEAEGGDYDAYLKYYIHSHNDGVMHWHSFSGRASGSRARLKVFLDVYDVKLSNDKLEIPDNQAGYTPTEGAEPIRTFEEGETKCGDEDAELRVVYWPSYTSTANSRSFITGMGDARIENDGGVFVIAFAPADTEIPQPESAPRLPELGAIDTGQTAPTTTVAGASTTTIAGESTTTDGATSTTPGETTTTTAGDSTTTTAATTAVATTTTAAG